MFRLDILKKELDSIDSSVRKIDDIGNSIKNWAILAWIGTVAAILGKPELYRYVLFSAVPPLVFMIVDAHWRKIQRRFFYRQNQISDFLNSRGLDEAFETGELRFYLLDPIARKATAREDFKKFVSVRRTLGFATVSVLYVGLTLLSVAMALMIHLAPPASSGTRSIAHPESPPPSVTTRRAQ